MGMALDYRMLAQDHRRQADATPLRMVRLKHLSAAEKFEILAAEVERFESMPPASSCREIFW
jgi:hypothetical protein